MNNIAIFASGSGSNFQAIADKIIGETLPIQISLLVCDKPGAYVIKRAEALGIPSLVVTPKEFANKGAYEEWILAELLERDIQLVVLAGYMRLIGKALLDAYEGKIINIHPSILPAFPGLHAIEKAFEAGVQETGVTVHYVDAGMDTGPVIEQQKVKITEQDTIETLTNKIHTTEHEMYPRIIKQLLIERDTLTL